MAAPGAFLLTVGSHGFLEVAANGDSAAARTGVRVRDRLTFL
jgi:S-adenosylmethionine hydrolase